VLWSWSEEVPDRNIRELNLNLNTDDWRLVLTLKLAQKLMGAPRHLGQHPGGLVLTHDRLDDLVPIEPARMKDRQIIEWDKDDVEALKFMKVDVLALGMLTCMAKAFELIREHKDEPIDLATIPQEDPATYAMIRKADTLGTFQIESRAQMAMLPRLKPRTFYNLVVQVAIVRPGKIQSDIVHPCRRSSVRPLKFSTLTHGASSALIIGHSPTFGPPQPLGSTQGHFFAEVVMGRKYPADLLSGLQRYAISKET
jgi:error-prone DNA polymerase